MNTEDLIWLGKETLHLLEQENPLHPHVVAQLLRQVLAAQRSSVRVAVENKLQQVKNKVLSSVVDVTDGPPVMPTVAELQADKLTLLKIMEEDGRLTPLVLLRAGCLRSMADLRALGLMNPADLLSHVGSPSAIRAAVSEDDWKTGIHAFFLVLSHTFFVGFYPELKLTWQGWRERAKQLSPADLAALGLLLGPMLEAQPNLWQDLPHGIGQWLSLATREAWLTHTQLSEEQYHRLVNMGQTDLANRGGLVRLAGPTVGNMTRADPSDRAATDRVPIAVVTMPRIPPKAAQDTTTFYPAATVATLQPQNGPRPQQKIIRIPAPPRGFFMNDDD